MAVGLRASTVGPPRSPRVAIITPYYVPVVGGISTYVEGLAKGLQAHGLMVHIWTQHGAPSRDVEVGPSSRVRFIMKVRRALRTWEPTVVHAHAHWYCLSAGIPGFGRGRAVKVFTVHTDLGPHKNLLWETYLRRLFARLDVITAVSSKGLKTFLERFPTEVRTEVLSPGVRPLNASRADAERLVGELDLRDSQPRICAVSLMMWPKKIRGLELLLHGLRIVVQSLPSASLVLVGDGPGRASLERLACELGISKSVRFVGLRPDPAPYLAGSDILAHISLGETLSQVVLEAAQMSLPVVANRDLAANFADDPSSAGIMAVDATPQGIAAGIEQLARDSDLRQRLGARGREFVSARFTWQRTIDQVLRLYGCAERPVADSQHAHG